MLHRAPRAFLALRQATSALSGDLRRLMVSLDARMVNVDRRVAPVEIGGK